MESGRLSKPIAKPAAESQTLRENRWFTYVGLFLAAALDIITFLVDLVSGDPVMRDALNNLMPPQYRILLGAVIVAIAQRNRILRYRTTTAIAPATTPAAVEEE